MRRLTLILSDLYLPADAAKESFPATLPLPALEWLLRFADRVQAIDDWRRWLARDLGAIGLADLPLAHLDALAAQASPRGAWRATPVSLEARLDHVRLQDRGLLRLSPEQGLSLSSEFLATFGPGHRLRVGPGLHLLLEGGPDADIRTVDPARWLDADIGGALPAGSRAAGDLRRLGAEIEMWLPGTRTNAQRALAGQRSITALWLWGGGVAAAATPVPAPPEPVHLHGEDAMLSVLAGRVSGEPVRPVPRHFADLEDRAPAWLQFAPMSGAPDESLERLEANWFAPVRAALTRGDLAVVRIVANDRVFQVSARARWRFWRGRRGWLESLGRTARSKA